MNAGIDFGTSNCSIGAWTGNGPSLLELENGTPWMPSALYTSRTSVPVEEIGEGELMNRVAAAKRRQAAVLRVAPEGERSVRFLSEGELLNVERGVMRRELAEGARSRQGRQTIGEALYADSDIVFGEAAIEMHLNDPRSGYFIKSPKSFLGAELKRTHIELFSEIITRMLSHIKDRAERQTGTAIDQVVLGRPVNFHGTRGEEGNRQALGILEGAAIAAGFGQVEFLYEPIAAALDYERGVETDQVALVVDAGGGTTDCSMVKVGPSYRDRSARDESVLGYAGDRVGGTDMDIKLAMRKIMPHFGKDSLLDTGLPIPNDYFWSAVAINDVHAQTHFLSEAMGRELDQLLAHALEKRRVARLMALYKGKYSYRLNRSAELAKIRLSVGNTTSIPLQYIEPDLAIEITRQDLKEAIEGELATLVGLMKEVATQAHQAPDIIYVTGGTAKSPLVQESIRSHFDGADIVVGDLFGSVTSGLTTWAHRIFR